MARILYIAPENVVGNLNIWKQIHESRGNECRFITYFPSQYGFPEDICLHLPLVKPGPLFLPLRKFVYRQFGGPVDSVELEGCPPVWKPANGLVALFFQLRDFLWKGKVEKAIRQYDLLNFDILHLETGLGFYRNGSFVRRFKHQNKPVFNTFHGVELRHRGVIPVIDELTDLNFTSELDLLHRHPNIRYLYLPFDVERFSSSPELHDPITICHATRNRYFKGTDRIVQVCRELEQTHGIRFILIENRPHEEVLRLKRQSDIYIDQIANVAPGYGMNSIESLSMGLACCTLMDEEYTRFMPHHPFINVNGNTLKQELIHLIEQPELIRRKGLYGREWVEKYHSLKAVGDQLYSVYHEMGVIHDKP